MLSVVVRTRALWLVTRLGWQRLAAWERRGWLGPLKAVLLRGQVQVLGGVAVQMRLDARVFPLAGAQAFGVLDGSHENQVQEALRRHVGEGDVVWDVGANIGAITLCAARLVGDRGRVVAIDPEPGCAAAIAANAAANGLGNVVVHQLAAAASTGTVELAIVGDRLWSRLVSVGEHPGTVRRLSVPAIALDDLDEPPPRLVKIDVEGAELEVIAGMRRLLTECRPILVCEMHGKNEAFAVALHEHDYLVINLDQPTPIAAAHGNAQALCLHRSELDRYQQT